MAETESSPEQVTQLVTSIIQEDLLHSLARSIHLLPFETRKDAQAIFSYVLRFKPANSIASEPPAIAYIVDTRPEVVVELCRGYEHRESAMPCGIVLREALKHESVAAIILYDHSTQNESATKMDDIDFEAEQTGDGIFWNFFSWIDRGAFEVSTDAFTTFRVSSASDGVLLSKVLIAGIGDPYQTQAARLWVSDYKLWALLLKIQRDFDQVKLLRHETPVYQATRRDTFGPSKL